MSFETALRLTEILLALAVIQQSLEHMAGPFSADRWLFVPRLILGIALLVPILPGWAAAGLLVHSVVLLHRYDGPYNGGADKMAVLCLVCVTAAHWLPDPRWQALALAYLAVQLVLSYAVSGWVKLRNPDWRSGQALQDVFLFSAYPVSEGLRALADRPRVLLAGSWAVILFEVLFPLALLSAASLGAALAAALAFHLANACLFGLNRFVWAWLAAYPSVLWLQDRLAG